MAAAGENETLLSDAVLFEDDETFVPNASSPEAG